MKIIINFFLTVFLLTGLLNAQSIKGVVIDASTSEPLIGTTIKISGTNLGAVSDMDGTYVINGLKPGKYDIIFSYIGFNNFTVKDVNVNGSEVVRVDASLTIDGLTTEEITVESSLSMSNENTLLITQKNSISVQDGISEQAIKKTPDASASDVMKRVIGVSIVSGKYVYVRGTSERYNNTTINDVLLPSTDPDKKAFSFDLFPSNLLENIIVSKTYTPDKPANYSGGLVQITTKEFPDMFTLNFGFSSGIDNNTTSEKFFEYNAGEKKFFGINLGIDNSRKLPDNFPKTQLKNTNFSREQIKDFGREFPNNWQQNSISAPINSGFNLSLGNNFILGKIPVGFYAAYSYKANYSNKDVERTDYNMDFTKLSEYSGRNSEFSILWGGLVNINAKINDNNKISFKSVFTMNSDDETEYYEGYVNGTSGSDAFDRKLYLTKFTQRSLASYQFFGEHLFSKLGNLNFDWKFSYSESNRQEPDIKTMTYQRELNSENNYYAAINPNFGNTYAGGRFFSDLNDINRSANINFEFPVKINLPFITQEKTNIKVKFGSSANSTRRNFSARNFGVGYYIGMPFDVLYNPIDKIFSTENFDVNKLFYDELTNESDKYDAVENNYSGFMMFNIPVKKLRFILGARFEYNEQKVNTLGIIGNPISNYLKNTDILPSVNIVYGLTESSNLRFAYSQTLSRPELREIAPFSYVDFVSGVLVMGNSVDLHRTLVRNIDLRYELFPNAGEIASVSLFYKKIDAPIEEVFIPTTTNRIKSFMNAANGAENYGVEFEFRKNLGFIHKIFNNFSINTNLALINSQVNLEGVTTTATTKSRRMQGQSPYMINVGLYYENFDLGTSINLSYNRFGERISEVGLNGFSDIRELGQDLFDFTASKKLFGKFEIKLSIKDILNQNQKFVQNISGQDKPVRVFDSGRTVSLSINYKY